MKLPWRYQCLASSARSFSFIILGKHLLLLLVVVSVRLFASSLADDVSAQLLWAVQMRLRALLHSNSLHIFSSFVLFPPVIVNTFLLKLSN